MKSLSSAFVKSTVALAAVAACSAASAFTFDPSKIPGVSGSAFSADTIQVADFAAVTFTNASQTSFTEKGDLSVSSFYSGGTQISLTGYGLYVSFSAAGSGGLLSMLDYIVYGYSGPTATFGVTTDGPTKTGSLGTMLASGSLIPGPTNTFAGGTSGASLFANTLTFASTSGAFSPTIGATASFINTLNQITPTSVGAYGGFLVGASLPGSGTINLVPAVPEPETYALMLGGLAALGFVARRRNNG